MSARIPGKLALRLPPREPARVNLDREVFGPAYDVTVSPQQSVGHDREFRSYRAARAYAEHLAHSMGWTLIDHCGEAHGA